MDDVSLALDSLVDADILMAPFPPTTLALACASSVGARAVLLNNRKPNAAVMNNFRALRKPALYATRKSMRENATLIISGRFADGEEADWLAGSRAELVTELLPGVARIVRACRAKPPQGPAHFSGAGAGMPGLASDARLNPGSGSLDPLRHPHLFGARTHAASHPGHSASSSGPGASQSGPSGRLAATALKLSNFSSRIGILGSSMLTEDGAGIGADGLIAEDAQERESALEELARPPSPKRLRFETAQALGSSDPFDDDDIEE